MTLNPDEIFKKLDDDRQSGALQQYLESKHSYLFSQAPDEYPDKILRLTTSTGLREVGSFLNGKFIVEISLSDL